MIVALDLLYMDQLNVRNIDEHAWRRVREEAARQGVSCGTMLNRILWTWITSLDACSPEDRAARAARLNGIFKDLVPPGRSLVDELIADRREEARREEEEMDRSANLRAR